MPPVPVVTSIAVMQRPVTADTDKQELAMVTRKRMAERKVRPMMIENMVTISGPDYPSVPAMVTLTESVTIAEGTYPPLIASQPRTPMQNRVSSQNRASGPGPPLEFQSTVSAGSIANASAINMSAALAA